MMNRWQGRRSRAGPTASGPDRGRQASCDVPFGRRRARADRRVVEHGEAGERLQVDVADTVRLGIGAEDHRVEVAGRTQGAELLIPATSATR